MLTLYIKINININKTLCLINSSFKNGYWHHDYTNKTWWIHQVFYLFLHPFSLQKDIPYPMRIFLIKNRGKSTSYTCLFFALISLFISVSKNNLFSLLIIGRYITGLMTYITPFIIDRHALSIHRIDQTYLFIII